MRPESWSDLTLWPHYIRLETGVEHFRFKSQHHPDIPPSIVPDEDELHVLTVCLCCISSNPNGAIFNSHLNKESLFKCWEFLFQRPSPNRVCFALLKEGREEMLSVGPRHPSPLCWQYTAPLFYLALDHANASKQHSNKSMKKETHQSSCFSKIHNKI